MLVAFFKYLVMLGPSYLGVKHKQSGCFCDLLAGGLLCRAIALPTCCFFGEFSVITMWKPFLEGHSGDGEGAIDSLAAGFGLWFCLLK